MAAAFTPVAAPHADITAQGPASRSAASGLPSGDSSSGRQPLTAVGEIR